MGQCGCAEASIKRAFQVVGTDFIIAVHEYYGCSYCDTPVGVWISFFDKEGAKEWVRDWVEVEPVIPDQYGSNEGRGEQFWLIGMDDLRHAARAIEAKEGLEIGDYESLDDLLGDFGLSLIQNAMHLREGEGPDVRRKDDPLSCARRFLLSYLSDFQPKRIADFERDILGLDPGKQRVTTSQGFTPIWDNTVFSKALDGLVKEDKIEVVDGDGREWLYQLRKPLPYRPVPGGRSRKQLFAWELQYLLSKYKAKVIETNDLPCSHQDVRVVLDGEELSVYDLDLVDDK